MRLTRRALLILWDYHAWAGALLGLVVYVMVLSGTITLFRGPLELWEEPIRQQQLVPSPTRLQTDLDLALAHIGATPDELWIAFPDGDRGATSVGYERSSDEPWQRLLVDSRQSRALPEREALATLLYHLHFLWHPSAPFLYYVAGIAAVGLLLAIVTGVLIHLRGISRQFHRFRPHEAPRTLWSDLHKVLGVVGLPFQTFYAYSGALLVLGPPLVATLTSSHLGVDAARARQWSGDEAAIEEPLGAPCEVRPLDELLGSAVRFSPGTVFRSASIHHHGRETGWVEFEGTARESARADGDTAVRVRERDGQISATAGPPPHAARRFEGQIRRLHFAEYGGTSLRFLYAVMGLAAAITILSGNWIWIARRREAAAKWLARLTAGVGAGILVAIAALFAASRILPLDVGRRTNTEELVFGCALFACVAWSLAARNVFALWWKMCALAGGLFFAVPFLAARMPSAGLFGRPGARLPAVIGVDLCLLLAGALFMLLARALHRRAAMERAALAAADSCERGAVLPTFRHPARGGPNDA